MALLNARWDATCERHSSFKISRGESSPLLCTPGSAQASLFVSRRPSQGGQQPVPQQSRRVDAARQLEFSVAQRQKRQPFSLWSGGSTVGTRIARMVGRRFCRRLFCELFCRLNRFRADQKSSGRRSQHDDAPAFEMPRTRAGGDAQRGAHQLEVRRCELHVRGCGQVRPLRRAQRGPEERQPRPVQLSCREVSKLQTHGGSRACWGVDNARRLSFGRVESVPCNGLCCSHRRLT